MSPRRSQQVPAEVVGLWPPPAHAELSRSTRADQVGYWLVPSPSHPRLLLPQGERRADRMLNRHGGSRADRAGRAVWRVLQRSTAAARLPIRRLAVSPEPAGIEAFLASALRADVRIGVLLGPPRANLKPVIQVFDLTGTTVAYAKLGLSPLTEALLQTEASALTLLEQTATRTFTAPLPLHVGRWHDVPILVQQALSLSQSGRAPQEPPVAVMAEIATLAGITTQSLSDSDFLAAVAPGSDPSWHGVDVSPLVRLHAALTAMSGCPMGSWHGDFGPWNMASEGGRVEVWDWERFASGVPVGFDAAHYQTQQGVAAKQEPAAAWTNITRDVGAVLAALDLDVNHSSTVAGCYLLAICARYRSDAADGPTPALRRRMQWLVSTATVAIPQIQELSDDLST